MGITASDIKHRARFTTNVETEISPTARKALQEDYRFSQDRKNNSPEAQIQFRVQQKTTPESSLFSPLRKSQGPSSRRSTNFLQRIEREKKVPLIFTPKKISQTGSQASQISSKRTNLSTNLSSC